MRKSESIIKLQELGLNTLNYFISENKSEILHYLARYSDTKMSMRTERRDEFDCPFYYMIPGEQLIPLSLDHLAEGYKLILSPSLDTDGCLAFGVVAFGKNKPDCIEFVPGEGKVREVYTHPKKQSILLDSGKLVPILAKEVPKGMAPLLNKVYKSLNDSCYDETPCCIEWSYYNRPVGSKEENLIVWEMRPYA